MRQEYGPEMGYAVWAKGDTNHGIATYTQTYSSLLDVGMPGSGRWAMDLIVERLGITLDAVEWVDGEKPQMRVVVDRRFLV